MEDKINDRLTLLIPYRRRKLAFDSFSNWLLWYQKQNNRVPLPFKIVAIENDLRGTDTVKEITQRVGGKYYFVRGEGIFHKTYLLNLALNLVKTKFVVAYDVDLIPYGNSLVKHLELTIKNNSFLVTGYRLMLSDNYLDNFARLENKLGEAQIAPEDKPTALKKHLISFEKMGVLPIFETEKLRQIGGWDENFVGWGGEDQDIIQRYCSCYDRTICKVPQLVYLHLKHDYEPHWHSSEIIEQNRRYYYQKKYDR